MSFLSDVLGLREISLSDSCDGAIEVKVVLLPVQKRPLVESASSGGFGDILSALVNILPGVLAGQQQGCRPITPTPAPQPGISGLGGLYTFRSIDEILAFAAQETGLTVAEITKALNDLMAKKNPVPPVDPAAPAPQTDKPAGA